MQSSRDAVVASSHGEHEPVALDSAAWHYGLPAIVLHWVLAILIAMTAALGQYMVSVEDEPDSVWFFDTHNSVGLVIALPIAMRVAWRLTHRPAPLPIKVGAWQRRFALVTQGLLYVLMVLVPVTGYLGSSYGTAGVQLFGIATPEWTLPDREKANLFFETHSVLVWVLIGAVVLHVLGALKDLIIDKDGVFERMWPFRKSR